jgi:hypothetical protein
MLICDASGERYFIPYSSLRPEPELPEPELPESESVSSDVSPVPPRTTVTRGNSAPVSNVPSPEFADVLAEVISSCTEDIELLRAPCLNGIVKCNDKITHYGSIWNVTRLWCKISKRKAYVELVQEENDEIFLSLPALSAKLVDPERSYKDDTKVAAIPDTAHEIQVAFLIYSSIKKAIWQSRRVKGSRTETICLSTTLSRKLVGLNNARDVVRLFRNNFRNNIFSNRDSNTIHMIRNNKFDFIYC